MTLLTVAAVLAALTAIPASAQLLSDSREAGPSVATFGKNGTVQDVFTFSAGDFVVENASAELAVPTASNTCRTARYREEIGTTQPFWT